MATGFIGRHTELRLLRRRLERVASAGAGVALAIRGRRQVGKSRLVQEFCDSADAPYVFYTATKGASPVEAVEAFSAELRDSTLPTSADAVVTPASGSWPDAFRMLAAILPDRPSIVVIDELPWLAEQDTLFGGALQTAWDRLLAKRPVLMVLLGSDIHMMERLTAYDMPFYGRADNLLLGPLNPAETARATGLSGADAVDAHLVAGGLPGILRVWPDQTPALEFIEQECADPTSPIFGIPETALLSEFPTPDQAKRVIEAVGSGDRTHANIAASAGGRQGALPSGTLSPILQRLVSEKHVLEIDQPLSTKAGKPALYRVADSNMRLYLAMLRAAHEQVLRGRSEAAMRLVRRRWTTWRGRAVEPLIRQSMELAIAAGDLPWEDAEAVGGWWNRQFDPELDLVGADRAPVASQIFFVGSIKWLNTGFDGRDLAALQSAARFVPGFEESGSSLVVVSLSGIAPNVNLDEVELVWGPEDVISAWEPSHP